MSDEYFNDDSNSLETGEDELELESVILKMKRIVSKLNRYKNLLQRTYVNLLDEVELNFEQFQLDERFSNEVTQLSTGRRVSLTSLKKVMPVRWYCLNSCSKSILAAVNPINRALIDLGSVRLTITPDESNLIRELITNLDALEQFSLNCSRDQVLTSNFLVSLFELKNFFGEQRDSEFKFDAIQRFRQRFRANVETRIPVQKEHVIAFLLDPQTKYSPVITDYLSVFTSDGQASTLLYDELIRLGQPTSDVPPDSNENQNTRRARLEILERSQNIDPQSNRDLLECITNYLASPRVILEPNEFWFRRKDSPLFQLFLSTGCIQLTSNKSEQTWSRASLLNTKKRSKLLAKNLSRALYINMNYKLCAELELKEDNSHLA